MKRYFVGIAVFLLAVNGCQKNPTENTLTFEGKNPVYLTLTGKAVLADGTTYETIVEKTFLLPEKFWVSKRAFTAQEFSLSSEKGKGLSKVASDYYIQVLDSYVVLYSGSNASFETYNSSASYGFTDFRIEPQVEVTSLNQVPVSWSQYALINDTRETCSPTFYIDSPSTIKTQSDWNLPKIHSGAFSSWDHEGWYTYGCDSDVNTARVHIYVPESPGGVAIQFRNLYVHIEGI